MNNVSLIFSEDLTTEQIKYIFVSEAGINAVYKEVLSQLKKLAIQELGIYGIAVDLAQSAGTAVADEWFGTSNMVSDYYQMRSLYEVEDLVRTSVLNTNGETFCAAFKMYENVSLLGCDYSKKFVEPLYTSAFGKIFAWATNQNYDKYAAEIDKLKNDIEFAFTMIELGTTSWYVIDSNNFDNMQDAKPTYQYNLYTHEEHTENAEDVRYEVLSTYGNDIRYDLVLQRDLIVYSDLNISGGMLALNGHTLRILGNFNVNNGSLKMTNNSDNVTVDGNFTISAERDLTNYLTAGTMEIKGNFYQQGTHYGRANFNCTENHKIIFNGNQEQIIHFDSPSSGFSDIDFQNSNIIFDGYMRGWTLQRDTTIDNDTLLNLNLHTLDLNGYRLTINGDFQHNWTIDINGGILDVKGNYTITDGYLKMTNSEDKVFVGGNFTISAERDLTNYLTAGTMEIKGNFYQQTHYGRANFNCTGTHKTILNGTQNQNIHFDSTSSHFNILEITKNKKTGYVFDPDNCWNELIEHQDQLIGDTNLDGIISISDATAIQRHLAEIESISDEQLVLADTNGDGKIDIGDATHLQKYLAEFDGIVLGKQFA